MYIYSIYEKNIFFFETKNIYLFIAIPPEGGAGGNCLHKFQKFGKNQNRSASDKKFGRNQKFLGSDKELFEQNEFLLH